MALGLAVGAATAAVVLVLQHRQALRFDGREPILVERVATALPVVLATAAAVWFLRWTGSPWSECWTVGAVTSVVAGVVARTTRDWYLVRPTGTGPAPHAHRSATRSVDG